MAAVSSMSSQASGEEPPMYLQRPSSARSQDVSHVLARTFRQLFTRDAVPPDTVEYLTTSKGGDDNYHECYVDALQKVQVERDRRMNEAAMLERHIMQAQARAMSADERALNKSRTSSPGFPDLGLPPSRSHFRSCIDSQLLHRHNLITPEDFATTEKPVVHSPPGPAVPCYARVTESSSKKVLHGVAGASSSRRPTLLSDDADQTERESDSEHYEVQPPLSGRSKKVTTWKNMMDAETREMNRRDLENLQSRVDFMKNPRFVPPDDASRSLIKPKCKIPKTIGVKPKPGSPGPKEPAVIFLASPAVLTFLEYKVGSVYEMVVELKNVTTVLRPIRMVPPCTPYFSLGLGQFPGEHGLVAPGMSCRYTVQFSPDSLADFDDYLLVHTQAEIPVPIHLEGRRPPPVLSLPDTLDVGQCLVGGMKIAQFTITNDGGAGRFCVMPQDQWPASNFKFPCACTSLRKISQSISNINMGTVTVPPFEVRPPVFQLQRGEAAVMEVLFVPNDVDTYHAHIAVVCDNCHIKYITLRGEGQVAGVQLFSVEQGLSETYPEELSDVSAQHLIRFDKLNPFTYTQRTFTVKNLTQVDVSYNWVIVKPFIRPKDPERDATAMDEIPNERVQDFDSAFTVDPDKGVLRASKASQFTVTYAPPDVHSYHSVLHLVLCDVPCPRPLTDDMSYSGDIFSRNRPMSVIPTQELQVEDVTALEIATRGDCEALQVSLQPFAIHVPGQIMVATAVKKHVKMVNRSLSTIVFNWDKVTSPFILEVEPPVGDIPAQAELDVDLTINSQYPGIIDHTLLCHVQHLSQPLTLNVQMAIKGPDVVIEEDQLDFGLVRLGLTSQCVMYVQNKSRVSARWRMQEADTHKRCEKEFRFRPSGGELRPLETVQVTVLYTPKICRSLRTVFELVVEDGDISVVAAHAEVQHPSVCLLTSDITLDKVYTNVPVQHNITMVNQTLLATNFQWGQLEGADAEMCSVRMVPFDGVIEPRQQLAVILNFTAHMTTEGPLSELRIPCTVGGMDKPIWLIISTDVKGLSVTYTTQNMRDSAKATEMIVDFGPECKLGEVCKQYIHVTNNSAICAPFSFSVQNYNVKPPTPPPKRLDAYMPNKCPSNTSSLETASSFSFSGQRRSNTLLTKTPNLADSLSKTPVKAVAALCRSMLREGKGAALAVSPQFGVLQAFSNQVVEVTAFTDIWGHYTDTLVCRVEKLPLVHIPVSLAVTGCPLTFQMVAAQPHLTPIVRFGTHVAGVAPTVRQMRINNTAPNDIRIDWKTFNVDSSSRQMLDFVVSYGEEFPLRDADGTEIIPPDPGAFSSHVCRPPSIYKLAGSPDLDDAAETQAKYWNLDEDLEVSVVEVKSTRPKVIHVVTRLHGGHQEERPYDIHPSQVIIAAKSNACINVSLTPHPTEEVAAPIDCLGYALGYLSLSHKAEEVVGKVSRQTGYSIMPLRVEMTAQIKPALLSIECEDTDDADGPLTMRYHAATGDLVMNTTLSSSTGEIELAADCMKLHTAILSNHTLTPLDFRLQTTEPFYLVEVKDERPTSQLLQTDWCRLMPRQNVKVSVGFRVSLDLLEYQEEVEMETLDRERKLHFRNRLLVEFNNKSIQHMSLHATLVIPTLVLSRNELDFSTCLVGQQREMHIILSNPTASHSCFSITQDVEDTFAVTPNSGFLEAQINNLADNKCLLHVYFTAKHSEEYESVFVISGHLGEEPQRLIVRGTGSYDGKHETLVNA